MYTVIKFLKRATGFTLKCCPTPLSLLRIKIAMGAYFEHQDIVIFAIHIKPKMYCCMYYIYNDPNKMAQIAYKMRHGFYKNV